MVERNLELATLFENIKRDAANLPDNGTEDERKAVSLQIDLTRNLKRLEALIDDKSQKITTTLTQIVVESDDAGAAREALKGTEPGSDEHQKALASLEAIRVSVKTKLHNLDDLLYDFFADVCGPVKRMRPNFLYAERELRTLFRLVDVQAIREEADDDIYVSQLGRAFKRTADQYDKAKKVQDRATAAAVMGLGLTDATEIQGALARILEKSGAGTPDHYSAVWSYVSCAKVSCDRLERIIGLLSSTDTYDELRVALLPARRRNERERRSPLMAHFWIIAGVAAVLAAFLLKFPEEDMQSNPANWWWLAGLSAAVGIAGFAIRKFFDWNYVRDVRKALHEVLFGQEPEKLGGDNRKLLRDFPGITAAGRRIRHAALAEEKEGFFDSPDYYWAGHSEIAEKVDKVLGLETATEMVAGRRNRPQLGAEAIIWNASRLKNYRVRGWLRWKPLRSTWKIFYDNVFAVAPALLVAVLILVLAGCADGDVHAVSEEAGGRTVVIGADGDGADCLLADGTLIQRSDGGVYMRVIFEDQQEAEGDRKFRSGTVIIPENQVRRIEIDGARRQELPPCGRARSKPVPPFAMPIFAGRVETADAPGPMGATPIWMFNKVAAKTLSLDASGQAGSLGASQYVRALARAIGACASENARVQIDVQGFASDQPISNASDSPASNHALAEGRRAVVLELISDELAAKSEWIEVVADDGGQLIPLSAFRERPALDCFDAYCRQGNPWIRFPTSVAMRHARSAFPHVAEPGSDGANEAFPRAVYITLRKGCGADS